MKFGLIPIALVCLGSSSCDKAKKIADDARTTMETQIAKAAGESGETAVDPALKELVDQTEEGIVFRKDLPFPANFSVKTTISQELSGRETRSSLIENETAVVKGTQTTINRFERAGDQIRYTQELSTFTEPVASGADDSAKPVVRELAPPSKPRIFRKSGGTWKADESEGFRSAALSGQLGSVFDQLLIENALAPRTVWFAKKRLKIGEKITVANNSLPMLVAGDAKGSLTLTLESTGAVSGHPCGVFSVSGSYSRKKNPGFDGILTDEEVSIESGKLWLSMIHPLVLREETDAIRSFRVGGQGNPATRGQGTVKISVIREWKATAP